MTANPKVYLAGPGVFRPDAVEIGSGLKEMCVRSKLQGLWPGDNDAPDLSGAAPDSKDFARALFLANCAMIRQSDGVVADITPFRGVHCDVGTAFEIGYALTHQKPIFAYSDWSHPFAMRTGQHSTHLIERIWCEQSPTGWRDAFGNYVEDFGLEENLMIACAVEHISSSPQQAIALCARKLGMMAQ